MSYIRAFNLGLLKLDSELSKAFKTALKHLLLTSTMLGMVRRLG